MQERNAFRGIGAQRGEFVTHSAAFEYALKRLGEVPERDKQEFIRWFFSGDFLPEGMGSRE